MATTNYNLPTITDNMTADVVRDHNALAEAVDTAIKTVENETDKIGDLADLETDVKGNLVGAINDVNLVYAMLGGRSSLTTNDKTTYVAAINEVNAKTQIATTAEAQSGTNNTKVMTPKTVSEAVSSNNTKVSQKLTRQSNVNLDTLITPGEYALDSGATVNGVTDPRINYGTVKVEVSGDVVSQFITGYNTASVYYYFYRIFTTVNSIRPNFKRILTEDDYNELFQLVSNGKAQLAAAITGKGVTTAADATFSTLANNINAISSDSRTSSGIVQSSSVTGNFLYFNGTTSPGFHFVTINSLGFVPSEVIIWDELGRETYYNNSVRSNARGVVLSNYNDSTINSSVYNISLSTGVQINANTVLMPVLRANATYNWIAKQ